MDSNSANSTITDNTSIQASVSFFLIERDAPRTSATGSASASASSADQRPQATSNTSHTHLSGAFSADGMFSDIFARNTRSATTAATFDTAGPTLSSTTTAAPSASIRPLSARQGRSSNNGTSEQQQPEASSLSQRPPRPRPIYFDGSADDMQNFTSQMNADGSATFSFQFFSGPEGTMPPPGFPMFTAPANPTATASRPSRQSTSRQQRSRSNPRYNLRARPTPSGLPPLPEDTSAPANMFALPAGLAERAAQEILSRLMNPDNDMASNAARRARSTSNATSPTDENPAVNSDNIELPFGPALSTTFTNLIMEVMMMAGMRGPGGQSMQGQPPASATAREALISLLTLSTTQLSKCPSCVVCQEVFVNSADTKTMRQMPCKHIFHEDCIFTWLVQSNQCPSCRYEVHTDNADFNEAVTRRMADRDTQIANEDKTENGTQPISSGTQNTGSTPMASRKPAGKRKRSVQEEHVGAAPSQQPRVTRQSSRRAEHTAQQ